MGVLYISIPKLTIMPISILPQATSTQALLEFKGYHENFLSPTQKIKTNLLLNATQKKLLPQVEGNRQGILHYENLSVLYNAERRLPFVSIYGIDAAKN